MSDTGALSPGSNRDIRSRIGRRPQWIAVAVAIVLIAGVLLLLTRGHQQVPSTSVGTLSTGDIETVIGTGSDVTSGDGGPARSAAIGRPAGLAYDRNHNLLVIDSAGDRIRMVTAGTGTYYREIATAGSIYTIAGTGQRGFTGDGNPATRAELALSPTSQIVADAEGNLLFADTGNRQIRVVAGSTGTFYGLAMVAGDVYSLIGGGTVDPPSTGGIPPLTASLAAPGGVAVDGNGNVVLSDADEGTVDVLAEANGTFWGQAMTSGLLYRVAGTNRAGPVTACAAGRAVRAKQAVLGAPAGLDVDTANNIVVALSGAHCVAVIPSAPGRYYGEAMRSGRFYPIAGGGSGPLGDGGAALGATLIDPVAVAVDGTGDVLVADAAASSGGDRIRVIGESTSAYWGVAIRPREISTVVGTGNPAFSGDNGPGLRAAIDQPSGVALDDSNDLMIADSANDRVREVIGTSIPATATPTSTPLPTAVQAVIPPAIKPTTTTTERPTIAVRPTTTTEKPTTTTTKNPATTTTTTIPKPQTGYRLISANGQVTPAGDAPGPRSSAGIGTVTTVVAVAAPPHLSRFWEFSATGSVEAFNGAVSYGSPHDLSEPIVAAAATADGRGYWLASSNGDVFAFGDAGNFGAVSLTSSSPIVAMAVSAGGQGYWLAAADGTVYPEGDASTLGDVDGATITAMAATPDGEGYWLGSAAGQVYAFGDAESEGGLTTPIKAIVPVPDGPGYWLVNHTGYVADEGGAPALLTPHTPHPPVVAAIGG